MSIKIYNYDKILPKEKFINCNNKSPRWPFRLLIIGKSGCGKTNLLFHFLFGEFIHFDRIYVYAKDLSESKYLFLEDFFEEYEQLIDEKISLFSTNDIVNVDELNSNYQNLIIFDDFVTEKDQSPIIDLFIRGRKKNASIIYISQSFFSIPKDIRLQCNYFALFDINDYNEIKDILRKICNDENAFELYKKSIENPFGFLFINRVQNKISNGF